MADRLADWYAVAARSLPWRQARPDPWTVVVSEFLLQQTRVETVAPRFAGIMDRIPTPAACAGLDDLELDALWAGLGYYRRARLLRAAAAAIVTRHNGRVPEAPEALAALPGFGPYTTGAVAAIVFDRPLATADGNVARVHARLHGRAGQTAEAVKPEARAWSEQVFAHGSPRILAQALMDLGATICRPRRPDCPHCPLADGCVAASWPAPDATPVPARRPPRPHSRWVQIWLLDARGDWRLQRRPRGLLGERWAPWLQTWRGRSKQAPARIETPLGPAALDRQAASYRHEFTHRIWTQLPAVYRLETTPEPATGWQIFTTGELATVGLPSAFRKGAEALALLPEGAA